MTPSVTGTRRGKTMAGPPLVITGPGSGETLTLGERIVPLVRDEGLGVEAIVAGRSLEFLTAPSADRRDACGVWVSSWR